jgi:hypothetical protein
MAKSFLNQSGLPRGLRNNNPGNLRPSGDDWKGMIGVQDNFIVFSDLSWGIRAMATDLANKISNGGLNTITKIVNRYAPASDGNDVAAYIGKAMKPVRIGHISRETGFGPNQDLPVSLDTLQKLVRAMIDHEVGGEFSHLVTAGDIEEGIALMNSNLLSLFKQIRDNPGLSIAGGVLLLALVAAVVYYSFKEK